MSQVIRIPKPPIFQEIPSYGDVVVEASAGTGKTYTLERLIIDLMLGDGTPQQFVPVEEILVVTYTERATRELKSRVRALLEHVVTTTESCPADEPHWRIDSAARLWLERQLFTFDRAPIHTIHGFCNRVLMENAFFVGKLFDLEHADASKLFSHAFHRALRQEFARKPKLAGYLDVWLQNYSLDKLRDDLAKMVSTTAIVRPLFDEERISEALLSLADIDPEELAATYQSLCLSERPMEQIEYHFQKIATLLELADGFRNDGNLAHVLSNLDEDIVHWMNIEARSDHFRTVTGDLATLRQVMGIMTPLRAAVIQAFAPIMKHVLLEEKAQGFFDYDDMLIAVWEKLNDKTAGATSLLKHLRNRYRYALIDEFQDTDEVQWNIFRTIFHESKRHRLFVIGDPKQAIYAFRGADVQTYLEARAVIASEDKPHVRLRENFRSSAPLIDAYNTVLDQSALKPFFSGEIVYDTPVSCGRPTTKVSDHEGKPVVPIELVHVIPRTDRIYAEDLKRGQGMFIAREIRRICFEEPITVNEDGQERTVRPRDVYILTHTRAEERMVGEFLKQENVPFAFYKQEGLFQTAEASDVLDLLIAIEDPYRVSNRLRAWSTPFFAVPFERLPDCRSLQETHPLFEHLVAWHDLAAAGRFDRLFNDVLVRSGIVRREIFLQESERELTNYQHILEVLIEDSHTSGLALRELILRLRALVHDNKFGDDDRNIQRLETEKDAVQIMTMHRSKGLEADVVFIFGGFSRRPHPDFMQCHFNHKRILYIGEPSIKAAVTAVERDSLEEAQRLLYVAVTRAKSKLYIPYIGIQNRRLEFRHLSGVLRALNPRLTQLVSAPEGLPPGITIHETTIPEGLAPSLTSDADSPLDWRPPASLLDQEGEPDQALIEEIRPRNRVVSSYSRMKQADGGYKGPKEFDEELATMEPDLQSADAVEETDTLPGGVATGLFLHDLMEHADFDSIVEAVDMDSWTSRSESEVFLTHWMGAHGIDEKFRTHAQELTYKTLAADVQLPNGDLMKGVANCDRDLREMEFLFPIPEPDHPTIDQLPTAFRIDRGFIKGYIDLIFEFNGRIYFADWKSDTLANYDVETLDEHVEKNYAMQAKLYTMAIVKHFGLHDEESYERRFGGYLYWFLRGVELDGTGVWSARPSHAQLLEYESLLGARTHF